MIILVLYSFVNLLIQNILYPSTKQKDVMAQEGQSKFLITETQNSSVEMSSVCPYPGTFSDHPQMEDMCISVDCVCFPL